MKTTAFVTTMLLTILFSSVVSAQQKPITGYAPVNGLKMYYEIRGSGEPVVVLHGAFMAITDDWRVWKYEKLSAFPPRSGATDGSRRRTTRGQVFLRRCSKERPPKPNGRN